VITHREEGRRVELGALRLNVPGRHNLLNALGAVAVGIETGVPFERMAAALEEFRGAERRFERRGEAAGVMVVDDYGHHPTEIAAVITAARAGVDRRVVVAFQPHRYTRTRDLMSEFGHALGLADEVVLTDIYAAGEPPIPGITIDALAQSVRGIATCPVHVVRTLDDLPAAVAALARSGDLVITLGAGSIGGTADRILHAIRRRSPEREPAS
jgi:UDP-N-acetylmuramate--alanine ligase